MTRKDKAAHLVAKWRACANAHDQYATATPDAILVHARAKRDVYRACADQLEAAFGLAKK